MKVDCVEWIHCQISHRHGKVPDQVRPHRIWWDLTRFWPDLTGSAAAPPSPSPILSNIGVFANLLICCYCVLLIFFCCGCYGEFFVSVICWCLGDFLFVCCCNGKNPRNPTIATHQNRSTDPLDLTTLMDGQRVGVLQTRLSLVG